MGACFSAVDRIVAEEIGVFEDTYVIQPGNRTDSSSSEELGNV